MINFNIKFSDNLFNQQIPAQQFQQPTSNVGAFNQPFNQSLQSQMNMSNIGQMNVMSNQMCMNPNQLGAVPTNPMANNAAIAMQAQMVIIDCHIEKCVFAHNFLACSSHCGRNRKFISRLFFTTFLNSKVCQILVPRWF